MRAGGAPDKGRGGGRAGGGGLVFGGPPRRRYTVFCVGGGTSVGVRRPKCCSFSSGLPWKPCSSRVVDNELALHERERERRGVAERLARIAGRMPAERPDRAPWRDREGGFVRVGGGNPLHRADDPVGDVLARLAVVPDLPGE